MPSRVVLVTRLRSSLGLSGDHDGLAVADIRHPDAVESLLNRLYDGGDLPIVTCEAGDAEEVRRLLTFASIRNPGFRALLEPLPGTPLKVGVLSSLVDGLEADDDGLPWRLSALDLLRERTWSAVWLPSVAGLSSPQPSLLQHLRSWLPGSGFLAISGEPGSVVGAGRAPLTRVDPRPDAALIHSIAEPGTWVVDAMATALHAQSVSAVETVREQVDVYGTPRAVEFAAVPGDFLAESRPDPSAVVQCAACGVHHARPACPSCKMSAEPWRAPVSQGASS